MIKPKDHIPPEMRGNPFEDTAAALEAQAMDILAMGSQFKDFGHREVVGAAYQAAQALQNLASKVRALQATDDGEI